MQREIKRDAKFKVVWNNQVSLEGYTIGEFIDGVELEFSDGGTLPMKDIDWCEDSVEYIQDIGLKDKNGKDIYEGYLLQYVNSKGVKGGVVGYVIYENCSFKVKKLNEVEHENLHRDSVTGYVKRHIVCGNIFENPELLK